MSTSRTRKEKHRYHSISKKGHEKIEIDTTNDEVRVKNFIQDMIDYYFDIKKSLEEKDKKKEFPYNSIIKKDLAINMNSHTHAMVQAYGPDLYITTVEMDSLERGCSILKRHHIPSNSRSKMVSWMMEIYASYSSEPLSFFLAVNIMDSYLDHTTKICNETDLHKIGLVSVYLASKMEDIIPLHMVHIKTKLGHDKFSAEEIIDLEKDMLKLFDWDIIMITSYDLIKTFLSDFYVNNKEMIINLKLQNLCYDLEIISIFLAKLICLHDAFYKYAHCVKAIAIIITAFDILRSNYTISNEAENFVRQWLLFLVKESKFQIETITSVYNKICMFYEDIHNVNKIAPALCRLHDLKSMLKEIK